VRKPGGTDIDDAPRSDMMRGAVTISMRRAVDIFPGFAKDSGAVSSLR
jgi:hypothetical protein